MKPARSAKESFISAGHFRLAYINWKIGNCRYLCTLCEDVFLGSMEFGRHLTRLHSAEVSSVEDYETKFGSALVKEENVDCRICGREMLYDFAAMGVHVMECHGIEDLRAYYAEHVYDEVNVSASGSASIGKHRTRSFNASTPVAKTNVVVNQTAKSCNVNGAPAKTRLHRSPMVTPVAVTDGGKVGERSKKKAKKRILNVSLQNAPAVEIADREEGYSGREKKEAEVAAGAAVSGQESPEIGMQAILDEAYSDEDCDLDLLSDILATTDKDAEEKERDADATEAEADSQEAAPNVDEVASERDSSSPHQIVVESDGEDVDDPAPIINNDDDDRENPDEGGVERDGSEQQQQDFTQMAPSTSSQTQGSSENFLKSAPTDSTGSKDEREKESTASDGKFLFRCRLCDRGDLASWQALMMHCANAHPDEASPRLDEAEDMLSSASALLHACKICGKEILDDDFLINRHVKRRHEGLKMRDYWKIDAPGENKEKKAKGKKGKKDGFVRINAADAEVTSDVPPAPAKFGNPDGAKRCRYRCRRCNITSVAWNTFRLHLSREHDRHPPKKPADLFKFAAKYAVSLVKHRCKVCRVPLLQDRQLVLSHVASKHGMKEEQYEKLAGGGRKKTRESPKQKAKESAKEEEETGVEGQDKESAPASSASSSSSRRDSYSHPDVRSACVFRCRECKTSQQKEFSSWQSFRVHMVGEHGIEPRDQVKNKKKGQKASVLEAASHYAVEFSTHLCKVCGREMPQDGHIITSHINNSHGVNAAAYARLAKKEKSDETASKRDDASKQDSALEGEEEESVDDPEVQEEATRDDEDGVDSTFSNSPSSSVCSAPSTSSSESVRLSTEVVNLCKYSCLKCDATYSTWGSLAKHASMKHKSKQSFDPKCVIETTYHDCLICDKRILCDRSLLAAHIGNRHKIKMADYDAMTGTDTKAIGEKKRPSDCVASKESKEKKTKRRKVDKDESKAEEGSKKSEVEAGAAGSMKGKKVEVVSVEKPAETESKSSRSSPVSAATALAAENRCTFCCPLCKATVTNWTSMAQHTSRQHKLSYAYDKIYLKEGVEHECSLCGKRMLWDRHFMIRHYRKEHGGEDGVRVYEELVVKGEKIVAEQKKEEVVKRKPGRPKKVSSGDGSKETVDDKENAVPPAPASRKGGVCGGNRKRKLSDEQVLENIKNRKRATSSTTAARAASPSPSSSSSSTADWAVLDDEEDEEKKDDDDVLDPHCLSDESEEDDDEDDLF